MNKTFRLYLLAAIATVTMLGVSHSVQARASSADAPRLPERFRALAANLTGRGPASRTVEIEVDRLSTDGQRERLMAALDGKGQQALLQELRKQPKVGTIRTPDSLAYDLRYARWEPFGDGGQQLVIATDRPISFWEARRMARSLDYPFTVIQLRTDAEGRGQGTMSVATKIVKSGHDIVLENYDSSPVLLQALTRER